MSSRPRLKPVTPLKSALPDVFLRKNKFEERMLINKRKDLENAEKKVIDRLAREQEEFAILNCVCIRDACSTDEKGSKTLERDSDTFKTEKSVKNESKREQLNTVNKFTQPKPNVKRFRRSKSDSSLMRMQSLPKSEIDEIVEVKSLEKNSSQTIYYEQALNEGRIPWKSPFRQSSNLPAGKAPTSKKEKELAGRIKTRATSAPTRVAFSGRDGRPMSLTPVIRQFSQVSLNDAFSRPNTAVKTLRDLPRTAQVQLRNNVYFLSQHKIQQQNEVTKLRTIRAMSAKTSKY